MTFRELCTECEGTGERDWLEGSRCYHCKGSGLEPEDCLDCFGSGIEEIYGGHGTVQEIACATCKGSGLKPEPPLTTPAGRDALQQHEESGDGE